MSSTTISPQARIVALVGVLLIVLAGAAFFLFHGHSQPTAVTPPAVSPKPTPSKPVHVVTPAVSPLLPARLRTALNHYPLVMAGFYNPRSAVDGLTMEEARAAAIATHVPFVPVNLLDDSVAGPLTALLPAGQLLPNPGFALYKRPGTLVFRSDGYLSRASAEQAVKDAR